MLPPDVEVSVTRSNRRGFPRHEVPAALKVRFTSETMDFATTAELVEGAVENISRGGLFVRSDFLEVPGTPVRLMLAIPSLSKALCLDGHVAWIVDHPPKGPGMGIRLAGEPMASETLDQLLVGKD